MGQSCSGGHLPAVCEPAAPRAGLLTSPLCGLDPPLLMVYSTWTSPLWPPTEQHGVEEQVEARPGFKTESTHQLCDSSRRIHLLEL